MTKRIWILLAGAAAGSFAQAQTGWIATPGAGTVMSHAAMEGQTGPVTGRPVEATEVRHNTQTLSDGTKVESSSRSKFWRDSAGRMRIESPEHVEIYDPVARVRYDLNPKSATYSKTATDADTVMIAVSGGTTRVSTTSGTSHSDKPSHVNLGVPVHAANKVATEGEALPSQVVNGIMARGSRVTSTVPAGAVDNDRDFKIVSERWSSDDLKLLLKTTNSDPRFGVTTYELTNIKQAEPDTSLFQIPANYTERAGH